jgi:hypothetical protein
MPGLRAGLFKSRKRNIMKKWLVLLLMFKLSIALAGTDPV